MGSISIRRYIRWMPDEASEPTSTIVLTSPGRRYVDLRILLNGDVSETTLPKIKSPASPAILDWAIAGFSSSARLPDEEGPGGSKQAVYQAEWKHWIDSRRVDAESASDEARNYPRGDGMTLERGRMVDGSGREREFEELWWDPEPCRLRLPFSEDAEERDEDGRIVSLVMMWEGGNDERGMVVRVGEWCQGLMRVGEGIAAERWKFEGGEEWERQARIESEAEEQDKMRMRMPCCEAVGKRWRVGEVVVIGEARWEVVEYSEV